MKPTTVRGTPVTFVGPKGAGVSKGEGFAAKLVPDGYRRGAGTVPDQFEGDQSQKIDPASGTAFRSQAGNPDKTLRVASSGRYGVSPGAGGVDMNDYRANGDGTILDGISEARDYTPWNAPAMDSPVPKGAQMPTPDGADRLNAIRNGVGDQYGDTDQIPDQLGRSPGGVMGR